LTAWLQQLHLRKKIILMFVLFIVLPILLIDWVIAVRVETVTKDQVGNTLLQLVKTNHLTLDRVITAQDETTQRLMNTLETQQMLGTAELEEGERFERFIKMDALLSKYSTTELGYSFFIPDERQNYFFSPDPSLRIKGVYYIRNPHDYSWFQDAYDVKGKGILEVIKQFGINPTGIKTVAYIRQMNSISQGDAPIGVLVVSGMDTLLRNDMITDNSMQGGTISLLSDKNVVLAGTTDEPIGTVAQLPDRLANVVSGFVTANIDGTNRLFVVHHSLESHTKLLYSVPLSALLSEHASVQRLMHVVMFVYFVILFICIFYFFRAILRPLSKLAHLMRAYEPGNKLPVILFSNRKDEIGILEDRFGRMMERLNQTIHDRYVLEIKQIEAELTILQSQINPHLLYNTLESIYWKTTIEGAPVSATMIRDLSLLMRIGLSRGNIMIPISEELKHVEAYLRLQLRRYEYAYEVDLQIDEEATDYLIPKVILQPLVENAILHGIKHMDNEGRISISVQKNGGLIEITVADNGYKAVDLEKIRNILNNNGGQMGYGITNVQKRIKLQFGEPYGLTYSQRPEGGTKVTLVMPAIVDESNQSA
jgi:two-component system sensor histidine kinase YesM